METEGEGAVGRAPGSFWNKEKEKEKEKEQQYRWCAAGACITGGRWGSDRRWRCSGVRIWYVLHVWVYMETAVRAEGEGVAVSEAAAVPDGVRANEKKGRHAGRGRWSQRDELREEAEKENGTGEAEAGGGRGQVVEARGNGWSSSMYSSMLVRQYVAAERGGKNEEQWWQRQLQWWCAVGVGSAGGGRRTSGGSGCGGARSASASAARGGGEGEKVAVAVAVRGVVTDGGGAAVMFVFGMYVSCVCT